MSKISFQEHPASVGESYTEHMITAFGFGGRMLLGGLACIIHGFLPFLCTSTGSRTIAALHNRMVVDRNSKAMPSEVSGSASVR